MYCHDLKVMGWVRLGMCCTPVQLMLEEQILEYFDKNGMRIIASIKFWTSEILVISPGILKFCLSIRVSQYAYLCLKKIRMIE